jgi:hypothetical protein
MYYHFWMHHDQSNDQLEGSKRIKIITLDKIFYTKEPTCVQHFEYHQGIQALLHNLTEPIPLCNKLSVYLYNPSDTTKENTLSCVRYMFLLQEVIIRPFLEHKILRFML